MVTLWFVLLTSDKAPSIDDISRANRFRFFHSPFHQVGLHAALLFVCERLHITEEADFFARTLYPGYSTFYVIGVFFAIQVPVVGMIPLQSLEQAFPLAIFGLFQVVRVADFVAAKYNISTGSATTAAAGKASKKLWHFLCGRTGRMLSSVAIVLLFLGCAAVAFDIDNSPLLKLLEKVFRFPLSGRVKALFGHHATKTGNPLIDSVSEHAPGHWSHFWRYCDRCMYMAPVGAGLLLFDVVRAVADRIAPLPALGGTRSSPSKRKTSYLSRGTPALTAGLFNLIYGVATYVFSLKMARLMLFVGPPAAALSAIAVGRGIQWILAPLRRVTYETEDEDVGPTVSRSGPGSAPGKLARTFRFALSSSSLVFLSFRAMLLLLLTFRFSFFGHMEHFLGAAYNQIEWGLSHPQIIETLKDGTKKDDYREAYWWLRDNTPEDTRVLAWWDYGYQLAGISKRLTIADGNTWNHEHIAFLGMTMTSPVKEAHTIMRHWADYVLVWAHTDLNKATHLARIGNSVGVVMLFSRNDLGPIFSVNC